MLKNNKQYSRRFGHKIGRPIFVIGFALVLMGLVYVHSGRSAIAACTTPSPSYGTDTISNVSVPTAATYTIWTRIMIPSSSSNEVLLQVDGNNCYEVGGSSSLPTNTWEWVDYQNGQTGTPITLALTAGNHTFEFLGNDAGVGVDNVLLLTDTSCFPPVGIGTNCEPTTSPVLPSAPTDLTATLGSSGTSVALKWNASVDTGGPGISNYTVFRNGVVVKAGETGTTYTDSSVSPGNYTYQIEAVDADNNASGPSNSATVTVPTPKTPITTPTNVKATPASPTSATITWSASSGGTGAITYAVLRSTSASGTYTIVSPTLSNLTYTDTTLSPNTTYYYEVLASDANDDQSGLSQDASVTTPSNPTVTPPTAPKDLSATYSTATAAAGAKVTLKWQASTVSSGSIAGYYVIRNGVTLGTVTGVTLTYVDANILAGTTYSYQVQAFVTTTDLSADSNTSSVTIPKSTGTATPTTPEVVTAQIVNSHQVNVTWSASSDSLGISGYYVFINGDELPTLVTTTSYGYTTAVAGQTYSFQIEAVDTAGNKSALSAKATVTMPPVATEADLEGIVTKKSNGKPIVGALISVKQKTGMVSAVTNSAGEYYVSGVILGKEHKVYYGARGYDGKVFTVNFPVNMIKVKNVQLKVS